MTALRAYAHGVVLFKSRGREIRKHHAVKAHHCDKCDREIKFDQWYTCAVGTFDGVFKIFRDHSDPQQCKGQKVAAKKARHQKPQQLSLLDI